MKAAVDRQFGLQMFSQSSFATSTEMPPWLVHKRMGTFMSSQAIIWMSSDIDTQGACLGMGDITCWLFAGSVTSCLFIRTRENLTTLIDVYPIV